MAWLKQTLTGADNETLAIGRVLGMVIAAVLLIGLPVAAAATVVSGRVPVDVWARLFDALGIYVPLVITATAALIWGTNPTEPKPSAPLLRDQDGAPQ